MSRSRTGPAALAVAAALATLLVFPAAAAADTTGGPSIQPAASINATVTVTKATLLNRVVVNLEIHLRCEPLHDVYYWETGTFVPTETHLYVDGFAQAYQAAGRSIAGGQAGFFGPATCDGTTDNVFVSSIVSGTVPFKSGSAVAGVTANVFALNGDPAQAPFADYASTGAVSIRLR